MNPEEVRDTLARVHRGDTSRKIADTFVLIATAKAWLEIVDRQRYTIEGDAPTPPPVR